eukprot:TRINITY_DN21039_c0_g2_i1.p1 TRINITY_DN21039_c0_g2~~TRINITY_DN21039_c0_g2_i1.p1  ORF type:complete len:1040 (-),score=169.56 TRINITY_DN21039_c0_g2_i1:87-3206(-)
MQSGIWVPGVAPPPPPPPPLPRGLSQGFAAPPVLGVRVVSGTAPGVAAVGPCPGPYPAGLRAVSVHSAGAAAVGPTAVPVRPAVVAPSPSHLTPAGWPVSVPGAPGGYATASRQPRQPQAPPPPSSAVSPPQSSTEAPRTRRLVPLTAKARAGVETPDADQTPKAPPAPPDAGPADEENSYYRRLIRASEEDEDAEDESDSDGGAVETTSTFAARASQLFGQLGSWTSSSLGAVLERLEHVRVDPIVLDEPQQARTDAHLNSVSIEYNEQDVSDATNDFDSNRELGSGAFGCVYKGTMRDGTDVAIKLLKVPQEAGFEDEVKVLSRFRHPNLVILMGFARHSSSGHRSLVYEYLEGGDVSGRLRKSRDGRQLFGHASRLSVAIDAASGLSHLVNAKPRAFHRDIKCPNILLDRNGTAKMADFGLACVARSTFHLVGQASGTPGYACPEYLQTGLVTEGSEVHSFGMVLLELLTGIPPAYFRPDKPKELEYLMRHLLDKSAPDADAQRASFLERLAAKLDVTARWPEAEARNVGELAFRCVVYRPAERPTFVSVLETLREFRRGEAPAAVRPAPSPTECATAAMVSPRNHSVAASPDDAATPPPALANSTSPLQGESAAGDVVTAGEAAELVCIYAEGVDLDAIPARHRRFALPLGANCHSGTAELVVGRAGSLEQAWEFLVQDSTMRARISREHFRILRHTDGGPLFLECLSPNGLVLNGEVVPPGGPARPLHLGDKIALEAVDEALPRAGAAAALAEDAVARRRFVVFALKAPEVLNASSNIAIGLHSSDCLDDERVGCGARLVCYPGDGDGSDDEVADEAPSLPFEAGDEFVVGRVGPAASLLERVVTSDKDRAMISRQHFKIVARPSLAGGATVEYTLVCLSPNGVVLNNEVILLPGCVSSDERPLRYGDRLALCAFAEPPPLSQSGAALAPPTQRRALATFGFLRPASGAIPGTDAGITVAGTAVIACRANSDVAADSPQEHRRRAARTATVLPVPERRAEVNAMHLGARRGSWPAENAAGVLRVPVDIEVDDSP